MSEISVLGFKPSSQSSDTDTVHWAVLVSPATTNGGEASKSKPRFFSHRYSKSSGHSQECESQLFDMHDHRPRQQKYPVPVKAAGESSSSTSISSSISSSSPSAEHIQDNDSNMNWSNGIQEPVLSPSPSSSTSTATTTSITSPTNQPLPLYLRIKLGTHRSSPPKLAQKLSSLLYDTPTYGPEDDWLRAVLDMLTGSGILDTNHITTTTTGTTSTTSTSSNNLAVPSWSYDTGRILDFACEAAREATAQHEDENPNLRSTTSPVLELDYAADMARTAGVKATFVQPHHNHNNSFSRRSTRSSASLRSSPTSTPRTQSQTHLQEQIVGGSDPAVQTSSAPVTTPAVTPAAVAVPTPTPGSEQPQSQPQQQSHQLQPQPQPEPQPQSQAQSYASIIPPDEPPPAYTLSNPPDPTHRNWPAPIPVPVPEPSQVSAPGATPFATPNSNNTNNSNSNSNSNSIAATRSKSKSKSRKDPTPALRSGRYKSFLGLRISSSPNACHGLDDNSNSRNKTRSMRQKWSFERQDDPYGGLM
ncbi:hypothetical protein A1O1_01272 [Capronia coronata CBS 617.96]|uniref:Uncharacterized protein n=1 Tax=Capronia coronata CBS 617.96 TaxID=1182541 RepID=W9Z3I6_9EURO|nr:uncharacterized protein A1O1_01272 [Capronia coronata CBS 617.96]EXJ96146.1 hypothetical protein A1O1_01272 [Capronia coronata CBS 617.96]